MKTSFLLLLLISFTGLKAQQKIASNENSVDSTFSGQIINDKNINTRIYLTGFKQTLDSTGVYTTTYIFGAKMYSKTFDVDLYLKFDQPLIHDGLIGFEYGPYGPGRLSGSGSLRNHNTDLYLKGQFISANHHFYIKVKSKQKPHPVINGTEGQKNF